MGVEEFFDLDLTFTDKELEQLDRKINKKSKEIERKQKKLEKKGGIFLQKGTGKALPITSALDEVSNNALGPDQTVSPIQGRKTTALPKGKSIAEIEEKRGKLKAFLESDLGTGKASKALSILQNPLGVLVGFAAPLMGAMFAIGLAQQVWQFLSQRGGVLSVFFEDNINTRLDKFRDRLVQADILAGFTQIINIGRDGTGRPRDIYNSFALFNDNKEQLENDFSIRNKFGN